VRRLRVPQPGGGASADRVYKRRMHLSALTTASPVIQAHAYAAFGAIGLGAAQLAAPKGTMPHRLVGWTWTMLMLVVVLSSFLIHTIRTIGPFSPIHFLSLFTLITVPLAVYAARRGRASQHRSAMIAIYALALIVTGFFTLYPGRIMHEVVFGP
jgi:uncharacterized membrane protein